MSERVHHAWRAVLVLAAVLVAAPASAQLTILPTPIVPTDASGIPLPIIQDKCADPDAVVGAAIATTGAGLAQVVPAVSGQRIYVCGYSVFGAGATEFKFAEGTGTNCATGTVDKMGAQPLVAGSGSNMANAGAVNLQRTAVGAALCVSSSAAVGLRGFVLVTQY